MLNAVDATLNVTTPNIIMDRLELGAANLDAVLKDGKLNTTLPEIDLYGGLGGMTASVDILTGKKSVLDYLLKPILKAKQNALRER